MELSGRNPATCRIVLVGITVNEISQTPKDKYCMSSVLHTVEKIKLIEATTVEQWLPRPGRGGNGEKSKVTKFQIGWLNKFWRPAVQHDD